MIGLRTPAFRITFSARTRARVVRHARLFGLMWSGPEPMPGNLLRGRRDPRPAVAGEGCSSIEGGRRYLDGRAVAAVSASAISDPDVRAALHATARTGVWPSTHNGFFRSEPAEDLRRFLVRRRRRRHRAGLFSSLGVRRRERHG